MYLSFWGVTRKELATQIFLCAPKSDFIGVKKIAWMDMVQQRRIW
jgi:hypothetical protein